MKQHQISIILLGLACAYALPGYSGEIKGDAPNATVAVDQQQNDLPQEQISLSNSPPVIAAPKIRPDPINPVNNTNDDTTSTAASTTPPPPTTTTTEQTTIKTTPIVPDHPDTPVNPPVIPAIPQADFYWKNLGHACGLANITLKLNVNYYDETDKTNREKVYTYNKTTAQVDKDKSLCLPKGSTLGLKPIDSGSWAPTIQFTFGEIDGTSWAMTDVKFTFIANQLIFPGLVPTASGTFFLDNTNLTYWKTPKHHAYTCQNGVDTLSFDLKDANKTNVDPKKLKVDLELTKIVVQALMDQTDGNKFGDAAVCGADQRSSELIPILIGVALVALVLVVLIAYIIGRRRSRARGYESM